MKAYCILVSVMLPVLAGCGADMVDVTGQVTYFNGGPLAGAKVKVGDKAMVITGADGSFSVRSVAIPYGLSAASPDGLEARVFIGLTRKDPAIAFSVSGGSPPPAYSATMAGHISGSLAFSTPSGSPQQHFIAPAIDAPGTARATITATNLDVGSNYSLTIQWQGAPTLSGTFKALQFLDDTKATGISAISYDSAGSVPFTLTDGQTSSGVDISLTAIRNLRLTGTISIAPGYETNGSELFAALSPTSSLVLKSTSDPAAFNYPAFSSPLMAAAVHASARESSGTSFVNTWVTARADGSATPVSLPAAPVIGAPSRDTAVKAGTVFSWSPFVGRTVYRYQMLVAGSAGPKLEVVTSGTSFELPDLSAIGFTLPRATTYAVTMTAVSPRAVDDIAGADEAPPRNHDAVFATTSGSFTTSP